MAKGHDAPKMTEYDAPTWPTCEALLDWLGSLTIIDAHEHLKPERAHRAMALDFACLLQYVRNDLHAAGMEPFDIYDQAMSPRDKWRRVAAHWPAVRHGSYARALRLVLRRLVGQDDLNDGNYQAVGEALNEANRPGLYRRTLVRDCRVRQAVVYNQTRALEAIDYSAEDLKLMSLVARLTAPWCRADIEYYERAGGVAIRSTGDLRDAIDAAVCAAGADQAVVGFKACADFVGEPDPARAEAAIRHILAGRTAPPADRAALNRLFYDEAFGRARGLGLPVAVHCGVWGDFTTLDVTNFIQTIARWPDIRFDLFHMSMPSTRQAAFVGKNFPNAYLNLCWSPAVSQQMFEAALDEWLDLVPINKISGFGGDVAYCPQMVYGYLTMCRESLARVFAARIDRGLIDLDDARHVLATWLHDTPRRLYGLPSV